MSFNRRSKLITQGVARSPNRAMLRAVGFNDGDFDKPIIGVANGHSTMNPCNAGIQPLVDRAMAALSEAGAMPQVFGVPTVTDGIGMGTEGMKYSLVSREVIADAITPPGMFLSQPPTMSTPSMLWPLTEVSIASAITSRETSEYFMPSVPMPMPSVTVGTPNTCGMAPASFSAVMARSTNG